MIGVGSSTDAAGVVCAMRAGNRVSPPKDAPGDADLARDNMVAKGFITTARELLTEALTASGFVHVTAGSSMNFLKMWASRSPGGSMQIESLKPSMVKALTEWVARILGQRPEVALSMQARVGSRRAIDLLT